MPFAERGRRRGSAMSTPNSCWNGRGRDRRHLLDLVDPIALHILLYVPVHDLLTSCIRTCTRVRDWILASRVLRHLVWDQGPDRTPFDSHHAQLLFWRRSSTAALAKMGRALRRRNANFARIPGSPADDRLRNLVSELQVEIKVELGSSTVAGKMTMCLRRLRINDWSVMGKFKCACDDFQRSVRISAVSHSTFQRRVLEATDHGTRWKLVAADSQPAGVRAHQARLTGGISVVAFESDDEFQFLLVTIPSFCIAQAFLPFPFTIANKGGAKQRHPDIHSLSICIWAANTILWKRAFFDIDLGGDVVGDTRCCLISESDARGDQALSCEHIDWEFLYGQFKGRLKRTLMVDSTLWDRDGDVVESRSQLLPRDAAAPHARSPLFDHHDCLDAHRFAADLRPGATLEFVVRQVGVGSYCVDEVVLARHATGRAGTGPRPSSDVGRGFGCE